MPITQWYLANSTLVHHGFIMLLLIGLVAHPSLNICEAPLSNKRQFKSRISLITYLNSTHRMTIGLNEMSLTYTVFLPSFGFSNFFDWSCINRLLLRFVGFNLVLNTIALHLYNNNIVLRTTFVNTDPKQANSCHHTIRKNLVEFNSQRN
jgi:hypothetical protein